MQIDTNKTIGQIVADDYRTAQIFKNYNIDFCCKGNRSIREVSENKGIDAGKLLAEIEQLQQQKDERCADFTSWPLDLLADYIEKKHHRYVEEKIPVLHQYLNKLTKVHGEQHPELFEIYDEFRASAGELAMHMKKEELVLFPFIRKMVKAKESGEKAGQPHFGTVKNPVQMMMQEHDTEGERFRKISELSSNYTPPADACNTYRVTYALLNEFEDDLHQHIHLENNILFPKAVELEKEVM